MKKTQEQNLIHLIFQFYTIVVLHIITEKLIIKNNLNLHSTLNKEFMNCITYLKPLPVIHTLPSEGFIHFPLRDVHEERVLTLTGIAAYIDNNGPLKTVDGRVITTVNDMANTLANYFS